MHSDFQYFVDNKQGEILYKTVQAPNSIANTLNTLSDIFLHSFMAISVFAMLASMSWKLVTIVIVAGVIYLYAVKEISVKVSYKSGRKTRDSGQEERVIVTEYTSGIKQIKVNETFDYWKEMFEKAIDTFWFYHRKNYFWLKLPQLLLWTVMYLSIGAAIIGIKILYPGRFLALLPLIGTFATGAVVDAIQIGITGASEIDTSSGVLTLDSAGGQVVVDDHLSVAGVSTFTGEIDANGGATIDNIQIGITGDNEIDTSAGNLTLDSAGGTVTVDDNLTVTSGNTLSQADLTQFDVLVAGASGAINDSAGALTFNSNVLTVNNTIDVTTVEVTNVKAKDGTTSITITDSNGHVGIASDLTVSGKLTVLGSQTEVNTETLLVEDSLIEVGLVNSGGSLIPPASDANIDVGVIFHYFNTSARKAAVYWDDSVSRIAIASTVSESASLMF